jgi:hypothetical protein
MLHPKTDEHVNTSVEVHHLVGKLSMAEILLTKVQRKIPTCPGKYNILLTVYRMYHNNVKNLIHFYKQLIPEQNSVEYSPMYQLVYDQQVMPHPTKPPDLHPHPQAQ